MIKLDNEEKLREQLKPTLWQYIEKEHIENMADESITDEEWELFIRSFLDAFGNEVSGIALEFWNERHSNGMSKINKEEE